MDKFVPQPEKRLLALSSLDLVRFPDPPYGVGRENEPPRSWEKNFGVT